MFQLEGKTFFWTQAFH